MDCNDFSGVLSTFEKSLENLEAFREAVNTDIRDVFKSMTKTFSDSLQHKSCNEDTAFQTLPPLIIENFDEEQVWQQLELRNTPAIVHLHKYLKTTDGVTFNVKNSRIQEYHDSKTSDIDSSNDEDLDYSFGDSGSEDNSEQNISGKRSESENQKILQEHRKFNSSSIVDDRFFKLSQLEDFLKYSDLKEERGGQNELSSDESDVDLFADIPSDEEAIDDDSGGEERIRKEKSGREIMYKDFFDPPQGEENKFVINQECDFPSKKKEFENRKCGDLDGKEKKEKAVRFSEETRPDKKLQLLGDSDDDSVLNENSDSKTAFERQQEKERKQIQNLEESLLKEKPWQLTGEIAGDSRPQDSLLHQNFEFDSNLKTDFVSTDEVTERVENIIKKAIENKAWCDVEIKVRPVEDVFKYKYTEPLNQAKSQKSLAEVYEDEYKKKHEEEEEKEDPRHVEIRKLMDSVATTLSSLFSHTPRPPVPEVKVVNNMPAITLEEVAPTGVSDATLLAPEEIKSKSGLLIGKSERTETDKKRERRKKKKLQKIRKIEKEERDRKKASVSEKAAKKFAKEQALKKLSQQKNVTIVQDKKCRRKN